jgi:hypothetical protein
MGCGRGTDAAASVEKQFEQSMRGVTLVGYSTRTNKEGLFGPERYRIDKVTKMAGDTWLLETRLKYDAKEISVPIPLTIKFAGDTPVITLTDLAIPGVGTWTARVLLYRDQYAGTWSGQKGGGQMFGKIVKE